MQNEFRKYATKHIGINSLTLDKYSSITSNYISPYIIEERNMNVATLDVFSRLMMDRIIFLGVPIYEDVANIIQAQLLFLESVDSSKEVQMYINSSGGLVSSGLGIYDTMQYINPDISTICTGMAASMAAVLLCSGTSGKRHALKHSRIMIHQPSGGFEGTSDDMVISLKEVLKLKKELYEILVLHTGQNYKKIEKDANRDYWMTSSEAKKYGMIDDVLIGTKK